MKISVKTKGHNDVVDITSQVAEAINKIGLLDGVVLLFVPGSTASLTTIEYEEGVIQDLREVLEKIAPENFDYQHHQKWGDGNGAAHLRSALIGASLSVPFENGKLELGTWQQIVLIDFDEKPREREVIVKVVEAKD